MKRMNYGYGQGSTTIFITSDENGKGRFYNMAVEEDRQEILEAYDGVHYYTSRSGMSGAGYLKDGQLLVPVGSYRVDTTYPQIDFLEMASGIEVTAPCSWPAEGRTKEEYPCFVRQGWHLIACSYQDIPEVLERLLEEKPLEETIYEQRFVNRKTIREEVKKLYFSNLWNGFLPRIWDFAPYLEAYVFEEGELYSPFPFVKVDGEYIETKFIGGRKMGKKLIEGNPLEATKDNWPFTKRGIEFLGCCGNGDRLVSQFRGNDVRLIAWRKINVEGKYIFAEESVNKLLFERSIKKVSEKLTHALDEQSQWYTKTTETASETKATDTTANDATETDNDTTETDNDTTETEEVMA